MIHQNSHTTGDNLNHRQRRGGYLCNNPKLLTKKQRSHWMLLLALVLTSSSSSTILLSRQSSSIICVEAYISPTHKRFSTYTPSWSLYVNNADNDVSAMSVEAIRQELDSLNVPHKFGPKESMEKQLLQARMQVQHQHLVKPETYDPFLTRSLAPDDEQEWASSRRRGERGVFSADPSPPFRSDESFSSSSQPTRAFVGFITNPDQSNHDNNHDGNSINEKADAFRSLYDNFKKLEVETPTYGYTSSKSDSWDFIDVEFSSEESS
jgi:hypothetical protein